MHSFPKARAWSIVLSTAAVMEGYDLLLVTSFFASPPWTKQYGTLQLNDKYELSAAWQIALYNGPAVGEIVELCLNGLVVERIGYRRTKGRTYAELDILFEKGVSARRFANTTADLFSRPSRVMSSRMELTC